MVVVRETRGARHYRLDRDYDYMAPTSFHQALPANPLLDPDDQGAVGAALAARAKLVAARVTAKQFAPTTFVVPLDQPLVPILVPSGWAPKRAIFQVYGVPIDVDAYLEIYWQKKALNDTDLSCVVTQPDYVSWDGLLHGREWGMWRLVPTTDAEFAATGCRLKFTDRGCYRIVGTAESVGYSVARPKLANGKSYDQPGWKKEWPGYPYGAAPPDTALDQLECWELAGALMLMSASGLAMGPMILRHEDLDRGEIAHVTGFGIGADLMRKGSPRWPAQANDGQTLDAPILEGQRLQLDPEVDVDALSMSPLGKMYARSHQRYGYIPMDCSLNGSSFSTSAEWGVGDRPDLASERRGAKGELLCFAGYPWDRVRVLAAGTAADPIPVAPA